MGKILVAGSINMDVVNRVVALPLPGETLTGMGTAYHHGGTGANQAIAAVRSGSTVAMLGAVGTDAIGEELTESLKAAGIMTESILVKDGISGMAFITVSDVAENTIVLSPGSNALLRPEDVSDKLLDNIDILLLQNEIPWKTNKYLIKKVASLGIKIIYNPAPAHELDPEIFSYIDTLVLNETEASIVTGRTISDDSEVAKAAHDLIQKGIRHAILTLGSKGAFYFNYLGESLIIPAFQVNAVDTTAAGDTFIGAYAAALHKEKSQSDALFYATAAAAIAVTRVGAQESVPYTEEVENFIKTHS